MKIKKEILKEFIKETSLSGDAILTEVKLDFNEQGMKLIALNMGNTVMVKSLLKKESFIEYEQLGKIAILNYGDMVKIIDSINQDDIVITKQNNMLVFNGSRMIEVPLADESLVKDVDKLPELSYDTKLNINKSVIDDVIKNVSFAVHKTESVKINFIGENDLLKIKYGTKYKFTDTVMLENNIPTSFNVKLGYVMLSALANITGIVQIQFKTDYPVTVSKYTDKYMIDIIIAPVVEDE